MPKLFFTIFKKTDSAFSVFDFLDNFLSPFSNILVHSVYVCMYIYMYMLVGADLSWGAMRVMMKLPAFFLSGFATK